MEPRKVRIYCYTQNKLSIAGRTLMSDEDFMSRERIFIECSCDMRQNCSIICYQLLGNREDVAKAVEMINKMQKK
jgi:hypothetical protein